MLKILVAATATLLMTVGLAQARAFTAKDLALLDRVSDPRVSPDGRFVAYNLRSTDWEANRGFNALWVMDRAAAKSAPRLVRDQEKSATSPRWSADGKWLYFLSSRSGLSQVWRTPAGGGESSAVTKLPLDVGLYRLSPDGRTLVLAILVHPECDTLACSKGKDDAKAKEKTTGTVYDSATPRFWDSYLDGRYIGLFSLRLAGDTAPTEAVALTRNYQADIVSRPEGDDSSFAVTADSSAVIFAAPPSGSSQGLGEPSSLYVVPLDASKAPARLDAGSTISASEPAVSPDGASLAYLVRKGSQFTAPRAVITIRDLKTGMSHPLADSFNRSPDSLRWSPDSKTLYAVAADTGQERIYAIGVASGAVTALTQDGHVGSFDLAKGVILYSRDTLDSPAQLFEMKTGGVPLQLTHVGEDALAQTPFSSFEAFSFSGWNDEVVHGYVVKPANYRPEQKYPVAFLIHGGPHGSFGNAWSYRWNPQVWAGMGYAVVMVDFHGSSGYGEAFAKSIIGHWGDRPLTDLQKGWAYALSRFSFLDGDHACALGGSYGGYMIAWIAGTWAKPWKCLVDHDGVFDIRLMSYSTDIPGFQQSQNDAPTWENPEAVERFNPIDHVADWSVPILVVHSGRDDRVPLDQGMGAYGAAQLRHVPSQLLYFPDENHWVLRPQNSVQWYATIEAWMKRWLGS
jgi:dipeptidyl aminopeptidase/acylaminoacyl peptidase